MIEFFRSHLLLVGIPVTYSRPDLFHSFIHHHSPIRSSGLSKNTFDTNPPTVVWSYYYLGTVGTLPYLHTLPYLTLPHTTYLIDLGTGTGSFNSSSIKENPHDRQQSEHGHVIPSISIEKTPFSFTFFDFLNFFRFFDFGNPLSVCLCLSHTQTHGGHV